MSVWSDIQDRSSGDTIRQEDLVLSDMLKKGIVHFQYRKKLTKKYPEGEIRDAWGTKKSEIITSIPHGGYCPPKEVGYTIYFDVEKQDWRAFLDNNLVKVFPHIYDTEEEYKKAYQSEKENNLLTQ